MQICFMQGVFGMQPLHKERPEHKDGESCRGLSHLNQTMYTSSYMSKVNFVRVATDFHLSVSCFHQLQK